MTERGMRSDLQIREDLADVAVTAHETQVETALELVLEVLLDIRRLLTREDGNGP